MTERNSNIPLKDQLFNGDLKNYYEHGKFPYLFFIQIMIVILNTLNVKYNLSDNN